MSEGRDGLHVIQHHPALGQLRPRFRRRPLQPLLPRPVRLDPLGGVREVQVAGLDHLPHPVQPAAHLRHLRLQSRQLPPLLLGHPGQLCIHEPHEGPEVVRRQNAVADLLHNQPLEAPGVEPGGIARLAAPVDQRLADVVGELPPLGRLPGERPPAAPAFDQPTEQVRTGGPPGMRLGRPARRQQSGHPPELRRGHEGGKGVRYPHWRRLVFGVRPPDQRAGVDLIGEHLLHGGLQPAPAGGTGHPLGIQRLGDVQQALPPVSQCEQAPHHPGGRLRHRQLGPLLGPVRYQHAGVAVGRAAGHPEATGGGFAHPPRDLLRQVLGVELVHTLNDRFHQLAGGRVVGVLGDRDHLDAPTPQQGLEGHRMFALAGEAGELPD